MMHRLKDAVVTALSEPMRRYRHGLTGLPEAYVSAHRELALDALEAMAKEGLTVHRSYMDSDGWGDGMKVMYAVVEFQGTLNKLVWHDSGLNGGHWMVKYASGGSGSFNDIQSLKDRH